MAYTQQTWSDGNASYPVSAARMTNIENGLHNAALIADQGVQILTTTQKNALTGLTTGCLVYDSTLLLFQWWNGTGWSTLGGDTGWVAITGYTNSWAANAGPIGGTTPAYRKIGNVVRLGGTIKSGATGTSAFTLPAGFRPTYGLSVPGVMSSGGGICTWTIGTAGNVTPNFSANTVPSLDGITFTID